MKTRLAAEILCEYYINYMKIEKDFVKDEKIAISRVEKILKDCDNIDLICNNHKYKMIYINGKSRQATYIEFAVKLLLSPEIKSLEFSNIFPDMYIFDDGQIHFNQRIISSIKFKSLDDINLINYSASNIDIESLSIEYYSNDNPVKYEELYKSNNYYSIFYGKDRKLIFPGDWIIKENNKYRVVSYKNGLTQNIYGISLNNPSIKIHPGILFSKEITIAAAKWWAQFLLEVEDPKITEQYNKFIEILANEIKKLKLKIYPTPYIQLGDSNSYHQPKEVRELANEICTNILFLSRVKMKIYSDSRFIVGDRIFNIASDKASYNIKNDDFIDSSRMIIKGGKFRVVEIDLNKIKGDLYYTTSNNNLRSLELYDHQQNIFNKSKLFVIINIHDFRGGEKKIKSIFFYIRIIKHLISIYSGLIFLNI